VSHGIETPAATAVPGVLSMPSPNDCARRISWVIIKKLKDYWLFLFPPRLFAGLSTTSKASVSCCVNVSVSGVNVHAVIVEKLRYGNYNGKKEIFQHYFIK